MVCAGSETPAVRGPKKGGVRVRAAAARWRPAPGGLRAGAAAGPGVAAARVARAEAEEGTVGCGRARVPRSPGRPGKLPAADGLFGPLHSPTLQTGRLGRGRRSKPGPCGSWGGRGSRVRGPRLPTLPAPGQAATPTPLPPAPSARLPLSWTSQPPPPARPPPPAPPSPPPRPPAPAASLSPAPPSPGARGLPSPLPPPPPRPLNTSCPAGARGPAPFLPRPAPRAARPASPPARRPLLAARRSPPQAGDSPGPTQKRITSCPPGARTQSHFPPAKGAGAPGGQVSPPEGTRLRLGAGGRGLAGGPAALHLEVEERRLTANASRFPRLWLHILSAGIPQDAPWRPPGPWAQGLAALPLGSAELLRLQEAIEACS